MGAAQPLLSSSLLGKGFDGHEAQPVAGGLVAVDDPTECKLAYFGVVSHPAGETVAHLIDKFLQRRSAQRLWFAWLRARLHSGHVVAKLPGSVPPHPFRGSHRLWVLRVTSLAHVRNVAHPSRPSRSSATRVVLAKNEVPIRADETPAAVIIRWPAKPTVLHPRRFPDAASCHRPPVRRGRDDVGRDQGQEAAVKRQSRNWRC